MPESAMTKAQVFEALSALPDPSGQARDLVEAGVVRKVAACDGYVAVTLAGADHGAAGGRGGGGGGSGGGGARLRDGVEAALRRFAAQSDLTIRELRVSIAEPDADTPPSAPTADARADIPLKQASSGRTTSAGESRGNELVPGVRHVIAVGAGKGGVGKSTVAVNLAVALARRGRTVGLLDGDIYGPSMPTLLGLDGRQAELRGNKLQVFHVHGIRAMTIGKLVEPDKPLIWRGPMAHGAFKQLVEQTEWGELDYLVVDLPPGTGDVPLTMSQLLSLTGAIIVCTPQKVAQDDAVRAARMFRQLNISVLGVVENMSYFIGDDGKEYDIFGRGGAELMAQKLGLPFLGAVPINMDLRANSDNGDPSANFLDDDTAGAPIARALTRLAQRTEDEVALAVLRGGGEPAAGPTLTVS